MIYNFISGLKNAALAKNKNAIFPYTEMAKGVANVLKESNYIDGFSVFKEEGHPFKFINVALGYNEDGSCKISNIKIVSKPGLRKYAKSKKSLASWGIGISIISTSRGIMSGKEASKKSLGGEVICEVR